MTDAGGLEYGTKLWPNIKWNSKKEKKKNQLKNQTGTTTKQQNPRS